MERFNVIYFWYTVCFAPYFVKIRLEISYIFQHTDRQQKFIKKNLIFSISHIEKDLGTDAWWDVSCKYYHICTCSNQSLVFTKKKTTKDKKQRLQRKIDKSSFISSRTRQQQQSSNLGKHANIESTRLIRLYNHVVQDLSIMNLIR